MNKHIRFSDVLLPGVLHEKQPSVKGAEGVASQALKRWKHSAWQWAIVSEGLAQYVTPLPVLLSHMHAGCV